jgi:hypothetical protein
MYVLANLLRGYVLHFSNFPCPNYVNTAHKIGILSETHTKEYPARLNR